MAEDKREQDEQNKKEEAQGDQTSQTSSDTSEDKTPRRSTRKPADAEKADGVGTGEENGGLANILDRLKKDKDEGKDKDKKGKGKDDNPLKKSAEAFKDAKKKGMVASLGATAAIKGGAALLIMQGIMVMKALMMALLSGVLNMLAAVASFFAGVFSAISGFFVGLGAAVAVAAGAAVATMVAPLLMLGFLAYGVVEYYLRDDTVLCVPTRTEIVQESMNTADIDISVAQVNNANKLWSVYGSMGGSKEATAAVLGNMSHESNLDPTAIETVYDEPFQIGEKKQRIIDFDFLVAQANPDYAAQYPAIERMGIGLGQWTNGRNTLLLDYADTIGQPWYTFDTQMLFMLEGDYDYRVEELREFIETPYIDVAQATRDFMAGWIGLPANHSSLADRMADALHYQMIIETATIDSAYAESIFNLANTDNVQANDRIGDLYQDDGCGNRIADYYGSQYIAMDWSGTLPAEYQSGMWKPNDLPSALNDYAMDPAVVGISYGSGTGWVEKFGEGLYADQCTALAQSYFVKLYPEFRSMTNQPYAYGDGRDVAKNWANIFGEPLQDAPSKGAVFSDETTSQWGHTGIVSHVFENGDMLIVEQNINGISGAGAGLNWSWGYRVIKQHRWESEGWVFFKPSGLSPDWNGQRQ